MRKRRVRVMVAVAALTVVGTVLLLRTERAGAIVCQELRRRLPAVLGAEVVIGHCEVDPLGLELELQGLVVTSPGATEPLVAAERASVSLRGLFLGGVSLQDVKLERPEVNLTLPPAPPAPLAGAPPPKCVLDGVKRFRLGAVRIDDGRVRVRASDRELRLEGVSVRARLGRRDGEATIDARSGALRVGERELNLGRLTLEAALDVSAAQLDVQRAEVNVEGVSASASGQLGALCDEVPRAELQGQIYVPLEALARFGVELPAPSGQVWARVAVDGRLDEPTVRADLQASQLVLGAYAPGDFSARMVWSGRRVILEDFAAQSGEGEVHLSGELQLAEGLPVKARVETRNASFGPVMARCSIPGAWVDFPASVRGEVSGHLLPTPALAGDMEFETGPFLLAARAYDAPAAAGGDILAFSSAAGTFRFGVSGEAVSFDDIALRVGREGATRVTGAVRLFFDPRRGLDITARASQLDLSDFGHIAGLSWAGAGTLQAAITGPYERVAITGQLNLRDFNFDGYSLGVVQSPVRLDGRVLSFPNVIAQKGQTQYFGDVALDFLPEGLHVRSSVQLPDGRVEDMVDLLADLSPLMENLQDGVLTGRLSALAAVDSPASAFEGLIAARVRDVEYLDRRLGAAQVVARFDRGEALILEPVQFSGAIGRLSASGRWGFAGPLAYELSLQDGSVAELVDPAGVSGWPLSGTFTAHATVGGDTDTVRVDGRLTSPQVDWKGRHLGPTRLEGRLVGRDLMASGEVVSGVGGRLFMAFRNEWPYQADVRIERDLAPFLPNELSADVRGVVRASGPMRQWRQSRVEAVLDRLLVAHGEASAANTDPVKLRYEAGGYSIESLSMKGSTSELTAQGAWGPQVVDLQASGSVDLRLLSSFVPSVERTQGRFDFSAAFSGPVRAPVLAGTAEIADVRFSMRGEEVQVRSLSGRADFSESRVLIQDVQGFLNDGRVRVRGDVRLDRLSASAVELQADLEEVTLQLWQQTPVTVSGALLLTKRSGTVWLLQGALDALRLRYTQPLTLAGLLASAKRGLPSDEQPDEWLRLDVDLTSAGDVRIDNNLARARVLGRLKLTGTNVRPILVGALEVDEGAQAYFGGNTFMLGRGLVQFGAASPTFDLSAQSQVRDYLISVKAFGSLDDPKVSLSSEPSLPETDVLSLLTLGVTSRERDRLSGASGAGYAAGAIWSASGLDQVVQRFLVRDLGLEEQQVKLSTTTSFNEVTGNVEPAVVGEVKFLSENLKLGVTKPVTGRTFKAQLEYKVAPQFSVRALWDDQNQNTTIGNPGVDLRFRFEWE